MPRYPQRIICLTEETTETLYLLGAGDRVVGVSGYTARPPEARQKPKVSAFINARFDKIVALEPDLILAFSDLQADIAAELIRRGFPIVTFNQRSVARSGDDSNARRVDRSTRRSRAVGRQPRSRTRRSSELSRPFPIEADGVFRRMGRSLISNTVGRGTRRDHAARRYSPSCATQDSQRIGSCPRRPFAPRGPT